MARVNLDDAAEYGKGTGSFFSLKEDRQRALVRFLYESEKDIDAYVVHSVKSKDGKHYYMQCLRDKGASVDDCPLCASGNKQTVKLFVPIFVLKQDGILVNTPVIWDRGKTIIPDLQELALRHNPLSGVIIEVVRCGKKGSTDTTYRFYPSKKENDGKLPDEICPELPKIKNLLDKTYEEMVDFVETGELEGSADKEFKVPKKSPRRDDYKTNKYDVGEGEGEGGYDDDDDDDDDIKHEERKPVKKKNRF